MSYRSKNIRIKYDYPENVFIAGTFTKWKPKEMIFNKQSKENYYDVVNENELNSFFFKFVINGEWKTSEKYPTVADESGNLNNCIEIIETKSNKSKKKDESSPNNNDSSESFSIDKGECSHDIDSTPLAVTANGTVSTTAHGTNNESLLKRIWIWIKAFFLALF
ncbi:hypothetical protein QEN19_000379 [Hanseniaspora menglaensis]